MATPFVTALESSGGNFTALLVGSTAGIGRAIALQLAQKYPAANITISGRSAEKAQAVVQEANALRAQSQQQQAKVEGLGAGAGAVGQQSHASGSFDFLRMDACSMEDVKKSVQEYTKTRLRDATTTTAASSAAGGNVKKQVDVLVLSQGIFTTQGRTPAKEGSKLDQKMALHYYSRMAVIRELAREGALSPNALIMSVLDGLRSSANSKSIHWDDLDLRQPNAYGLRAAAEHCLGLTDIMFQHFDLDSALDSVSHTQPASSLASSAGAGAAATSTSRRTYVHAYPGFVDTDIMSSSKMPSMLRYAVKGLSSVIATRADVCADRLVQGLWEANRQGKGWANIDDKGRLVANKAVADEQRRKEVAEFTWKTIDEEGN